eukprot:CAMPEP_0203742952 /NCGR_PEP_ID=MMETSP0092-20131115/59189_1 /ASSEMBLY_ACC=CAM_ASM_001090 /TAXON_ID=426623 /ORGANISM="Chaetoceros affinis, Strain CCMP159" /LENGTH=436 /DNA_ID=CAMNT_0050630227 /DNA_START=546 /DNA_END=1853 /DNA_ORIENTATION=-
MGVCLEDESIDCPVSNYQLFMQPSGLCMGAAKCAYEKCAGGPDTPFNRFTFNSTTFPEELWKDADNFDLPTAVVHPAHVGDVSAAIKFAAEHKIGVSVKTSGHSYTGSSTKKGTILLNLSKLQKYAPSGSIIECQVDPNIKEGAFQDACNYAIGRNKPAVVRVGGGEIWDEVLRAVSFQDACNYAIGRNKPAVVRVGGGEIWDEVLRAVSVDWNENEKTTKKYHIVSGAAGTVSAAGGWLASGGLSGNNGMRLYGLGVDQVLHVEMVLPSGMHVRFGPTEWRKKANKMYPVTTHVKGYCNQGDLSDEDLWDWQECSQDIDFYGLWFAVRGGGGGSYGVITSIYYQLHDYTPLDMVFALPFPGVDVGSLPVEKLLELLKKAAEFILRFFFLPESIGVTEFASNSCSSPDSGGTIGGLFQCFNGAGSIMKGAWERFYP